ncbi:glutamate receptor ionotropic, delta-2-like [Daphnia pulicaria]|uniref:glutamate receptor ionotropic, delta-2-like n=1 Tax=Daphnia pulicaria TaxID=35523 RepID=UPI001EEC0398|nr:glutamate receptor ionotropic, delta-2-like [Daphnia pulicaria]
MAQQYQLRITFVPVNQSEIIKFGITQAIINQLVKTKEVDIIPMVLIPTVERARLMDFTIPLLIGNSRLMLRYPEEASRLAAAIQPFTLLTWASLLITFIGMIGTLVVFSLYQNSRKSRPVPMSFWEILGRNTLITLALLTGQGYYIPQNLRLHIRIPIALWCLVAVVICNAYSGTLTSFLTVTKMKPIINSLEELASSDHYKLTAEYNSAFNDKFLKAKSGYLKVLGDSLRQNPHLLFRDYSEANENVLNKNAVYMRGSIDILSRIYDDMKANNGKCRLTASKPFGDVQFLSFGLKKGQNYNSAFSKGLTRLRESGLLTYWFSQITPNIDKCLITSNNVAKLSSSKISRLNIVDASSIFLLLIVGILSSLIGFLGELTIRYLKR